MCFVYLDRSGRVMHVAEDVESRLAEFQILHQAFRAFGEVIRCSAGKPALMGYQHIKLTRRLHSQQLQISSPESDHGPLGIQSVAVRDMMKETMRIDRCGGGLVWFPNSRNPRELIVVSLHHIDRSCDFLSNLREKLRIIPGGHGDLTEIVDRCIPLGESVVWSLPGPGIGKDTQVPNLDQEIESAPSHGLPPHQDRQCVAGAAMHITYATNDHGDDSSP